MGKIGNFKTDAGDNIPAVINGVSGGLYDIMTLGYSNTRKRVTAAEIEYADGADHKTLFVSQVEDFESQAATELGVTVVGSEITIPNEVVVVPVGTVDLGSSHILLDGGTIMGRDAVKDGFLSTTTGGVVRHNGGTVSSENYFIIAPAGPGFVGTGSKANGDILKLNMIGVFASPIGFDLTGYLVPSMDSCYVGPLTGIGNPAKGVVFKGTVGKIHLQNTPFLEVTDAVIEFAADLNVDEMDIAGNYYAAAVGVKFMRGVSGWTLNNIAEVSRNIPKGVIGDPTDRLEGINLYDPKFSYQSNPGFPDSKALAILQQDGTGFETTTVTTQNTAYKANITTVGSPSNQRFTASADGTLTYTGVRPWTVLVTVGGRVDTATNNQEIQFSIYKDGSEIVSSRTVTKVTTGGDQRNFKCTTLVTVQPPEWHDPVVGNCTLELYVTNLSSDADIILADVAMHATS